jgi:single-stranded-DNA-specific exonuclease
MRNVYTNRRLQDYTPFSEYTLNMFDTLSSMKSLSVTGKRWDLGSPDERLVITFCQRYQLPEILSRILVNRGITLETVETYLQPSLRSLLPDPSCLLDMDKAVTRTLKALADQQKIVVYGDYDVDGACASALLRQYFNQIGYPIDLYIPDRIEEGYGANSQALETLHNQGFKLVLMVDCGTNGFEPLERAHQLGLDIIVLDHHTAEPRLPPTAALVNPNRLDQDANTNALLKNLCAAGVTYLFLVALQRALREQGWFNEKKIVEPNLLSYLDFVALGTVCDVMPLTGLNRAFVSQGLKILSQRKNLGLKALADIAGVSEMLNTYHLGFVLGPRINAGGRVGQSNLGSRLLTSGDHLEIQDLARNLHQFNQQRQEIEKDVLDQAIEQIETQNLHKNPVILVGQENWHPGVIGIVASRLKEQYSRPACVVGFDKGLGKGSGRSVYGVCLGTAMHVAVHKGLLDKGGGHAMAAGFTVQQHRFEEFYQFLNDHMGEHLKNYYPVIRLDGYLSLSALTPQLLLALQQFEPYGQGNPTPHFAFRNIQISYLDKVGENHLRCQIADQEGNRLKAMAFRSRGTTLGEFLEKSYHQKTLISLAGTARLDSWNSNQQVSFFIEDAACI